VKALCSIPSTTKKREGEKEGRRERERKEERKRERRKEGKKGGEREKRENELNTDISLPNLLLIRGHI
jgi:hypothetical protein